jgi:hypothetical protein
MLGRGETLLASTPVRHGKGQHPVDTRDSSNDSLPSRISTAIPSASVANASRVGAEGSGGTTVNWVTGIGIDRVNTLREQQEDQQPQPQQAVQPPPRQVVNNSSTTALSVSERATDDDDVEI